jgi:hypothetical protein
MNADVVVPAGGQADALAEGDVVAALPSIP